MGKLDQAFDLVNGQRREALAQFLNRFPEVEAIHNGVGQNARPAHDGLS